MRHGVGQDHEYNDTKGTKPLGCYFCNDVVAPTDVSFFLVFVIPCGLQ